MHLENIMTVVTKVRIMVKVRILTTNNNNYGINTDN